MKVSDFQFDLPERLIAQQPLAQRSASRLLHLDRATGQLSDRRFADLPDLLRPEDLLVFNNTRVIPARLWARKESGGKVEILVERLVDSRLALVQLKANRKPGVGAAIVIEGVVEGGARHDIEGREGEFWLVRVLDGPDWAELLDSVGHMPLPPYIQRPDNDQDRERYQTVFGHVPGAVAAPTAGLHFDDEIMARLDQLGVEKGFCTLHVGAGTFQPVRVENLADHQMHAEWLTVDERLITQVRQTRARGGRVVAVGTTAVRALETAAANGELKPYVGDSRLFLYPGCDFRVVDAMVTNFHLPGSTLLMLVSAFAGREQILAAYQHAIEAEYRFFSYGDAMFLE
ncbi:MAG: tRNA preQ1(34) S-adenosylmethionine ribosyltransferase-isomerase QueA [Wenzhouxiangella sp.]